MSYDAFIPMAGYDDAKAAGMLDAPSGTVIDPRRVVPSSIDQSKTAQGTAASTSRKRSPDSKAPAPRDWGEPMPLPGGRISAPFCAGVLGDRVAAIVGAVAGETATPPDLAGLAALGVCSAVIAGAVVVEPHQGWHEPVNLYINGLAAPGEGKTPVMKRMIHPLDVVERDRVARIAPVIVEAEGRKRVAEQRRKNCEATAAKAKPQDRQAAQELADEANREAAEVFVPATPRLYTRDATPEALVRLLGEQNGRMAVVTDEGSEFYENAARYSATGKGNLGIYVDGFDGKRHLSDRAGRNPIIIECTTLTVCLLGQPIVLEDLASDRQAKGRGLLARFLWSRPPSGMGRRPVNREPVSDALVSQWEDLIVSLANEAEKITEPVVLCLNAEAHRLFDEWRGHHEGRLRESGDLGSVVEWASKLPGQVLRLAGNLHALRQGTLSGTIDSATMDAALELAGYFTNHALAVFGLMGTDPATTDATKVLHWIEDRGLGVVSTRDVSNSKDWLPRRTRAALDLLAEYGWVRRAESPLGPGRPSEGWEIHPELAAQNGAKPKGM